MLFAKGDIFIVSAKLDLLTFTDNITVCVDSCIAGGTVAAPADGFQFLDLICYSAELLGCGKGIQQKIIPQAIAYDRNLIGQHNVGEHQNFFYRTELDFVYDNTVVLSCFFKNFFHAAVQIVTAELAFTLKTYPTLYYFFTVQQVIF